MGDLSQAQVDAVIAHLSAEYDAAEKFTRAKAAELVNWWNSAQILSTAKAIHDSRAANIRELTAAAERHPDEFARLAAADEKDLRDLSGYSQLATVEKVLADTATATATEVGEDVGKAGAAVAGFGWEIFKHLPWWAYAGGAAVVGGIGWFYVRPLLPRRAAA